ncbi:MAG TPA: hypothetical protein VLB73_02345 [Patescibacteria group bacterium]|jgi:hypothetical protein|nr:hypothetical protein [Patescibacteria group bacterium]
MDTAQIILLVIVGVLSLLLVVLGIQVFLILKSVRSAINRVNKVLGDAGLISESISKPVVSMSTVLSGVKLGSLIASFLTDKKKHTREDE